MSTPAVTPITSFKQFQELLDSNKLFVVYFWATWCGPCRVIGPVFERLAEDKEFNEKIEFYAADMDDHISIAQEVGIRVLPTFMMFKDGKKIDAVSGAEPRGLLAMISKATAGL